MLVQSIVDHATGLVEIKFLTQAVFVFRSKLLILYNFQCQQCNQVSEHFFNMSDCPVTVQCKKCKGIAHKIISVSGPSLISESPDWIRSVLEVVEKGSDKQHCQEFLKDPTRDNYHKWMKGANVRHIEAGEKPGRPNSAPESSVITDMLMKHRQEKRALCLRR